MMKSRVMRVVLLLFSTLVCVVLGAPALADVGVRDVLEVERLASQQAANQQAETSLAWQTEDFGRGESAALPAGSEESVASKPSQLSGLDGAETLAQRDIAGALPSETSAPIEADEPVQADMDSSDSTAADKPSEPFTAPSQNEGDSFATDPSLSEALAEGEPEANLLAAESELELYDEPSLEASAEQASSVGRITMWRLYNPNSGEHFYTGNLGEARAVAKAGWHWEGVGWIAPSQGDPVYRLYNPNAGDHHYTVSKHERDWLITLGWRYEGIGWYSDKNKTLAVLRQYNPNSRTGSHNFTINKAEYNKLASLGWQDEGVGWYAIGSTNATAGGYWIEGPGKKKAWVQPDGRVATGLFKLHGASYYAPKPVGWVIAGKTVLANGDVALADASGKLEARTGWVVTNVWGDGIQRYWLERTSAGYVVAKTGHFTVSGNHYYGLPQKGYVLRGKLSMGSGVLLADNGGKLAWKEGWLVTGTYDGGALERYWIDTSPGGGLHGARVGSFKVAGKSYFGLEKKGYVLRNAKTTIGGDLYQANNDGVLTQLPSFAPGSPGARAQGYASPTPYLIMVDLSNHQVVVFKGTQGSWSQIRSMICTVGKPTTPTIRGVFSIGNRGYSFGHGYTCYYWTQFSGNYLFHTVKYVEATWVILDGRLGVDASSGCVRLGVDDAKWINQNMPRGTTVVVY